MACLSRTDSRDSMFFIQLYYRIVQFRLRRLNRMYENDHFKTINTIKHGLNDKLNLASELLKSINNTLLENDGNSLVGKHF